MTIDSDSIWDSDPNPDDDPKMLGVVMGRLADLNERLENIEADLSVSGIQEQITSLDSKLDSALKAVAESLLSIRRAAAHNRIDEVFRHYAPTVAQGDTLTANELSRTLGGALREIVHVDEPEAIVESVLDHWKKLLIKKHYLDE